MRYAILILAIILFFCSCSDDSKSDLAVFKLSHETLLRTMEEISAKNSVLYKAFENNLQDPITGDFVKIWYPKAKRIKALSLEMYAYIDRLIEDLTKEAGIIIGEADIYYEEGNMTAVSRLFKNKGKGIELYKKLKKYKEDIFSIDTLFPKSLTENSVIITNDFDTQDSVQRDFTNIFFSKVPAIAASATLRMFQNNVKIIENNFVEYYFYKTTHVKTDGDGVWAQPLISQSSKYVKAGEEIEVIAGIGFTFQSLKPQITIGKKVIKINEEGLAVYKLKTSLQSGKYYIPVRIEYTDPNGIKCVKGKSIEYTVTEDH